MCRHNMLDCMDVLAYILCMPLEFHADFAWNALKFMLMTVRMLFMLRGSTSRTGRKTCVLYSSVNHHQTNSLVGKGKGFRTTGHVWSHAMVWIVQSVHRRLDVSVGPLCNNL